LCKLTVKVNTGVVALDLLFLLFSAFGSDNEESSAIFHFFLAFDLISSKE
jgi:hypothetical protein